MLPKKEPYELNLKSGAEEPKNVGSGTISETNQMVEENSVEYGNSPYEPDQNTITENGFVFVEIKSFNFGGNAQSVVEEPNVAGLGSEHKEDKVRTLKQEEDSSGDNINAEELLTRATRHIYTKRIIKKKPTAKRKLKNSIKLHIKDKPHECKICEKRFSTTSQLTRHMNSHTGNRPYKCQYCEASFGDPSTKIKHETIHTNERPYKCSLCSKAFAYSSALKRHMMTHTGEKPHTCDYCEKRFSQMHHKTAHERRHTNINMVLLENPPDVRFSDDDDLEC